MQVCRDTAKPIGQYHSVIPTTVISCRCRKTITCLCFFMSWMGMNLQHRQVDHGWISIIDAVSYTDQDQKFLDPHHTITSGLEDP
ncbi:syntaxin of plants 121 [Prunus dulcis]|uniref:Syntaxin of plants 121 n=1 Tax=Prunus dulcis TaxID=3755 RepID=A0A4Y1RCI0_PRUDU|nr:syntaxin of plants 121 [Prunus dulcis]